MTRGKRILAALVGALALSALAAPTVSDLKVTAITPGGLVLDYTVAGVTAADVNLPLDVSVTDGTQAYYAQSLVGVTNCVNGAHRVYWNMAADGLSEKATNGIVTVTYRDRTTWKAYCVIDLSGGSDATKYPVTYLDDIPTGGRTDAHKTSKIVLRRIDKPSGTYYAGIFEVTEAQWANVMGGTSASTKPKSPVSYNMIRGDAGTYDWPNSNAVAPTSFMGRLRQKTGLSTLDLPSEAEWEYAARAGVTTKWLCGDSETDLAYYAWYDYAWYGEYNGNETRPVGTRRANAWGLYDVHGNVWEWCLDMDYSEFNRGYDNRVLRGGSYRDVASVCAFSCRNIELDPSYGRSGYGFRLFCRPGSN